jgi:hypothetical protein
MYNKINLYNLIYKIVGYSAALLSFVFVGFQFVHNAPALSGILINWKTSVLLLMASCSCFVFFFLLIFGWHLFLQILHGKLQLRNSFYIYTRASIAKYLPGNVGHLLGRNLIASRFGLPHNVVAISTILEILCLITTALMICVWIDLPMAPPLPPSVSLSIGLGILIIAPVAIFRFIKKKAA